MDEKICHLCPCRRDCWDHFVILEHAISNVAVVEHPLVIIHDTRPQDLKPTQSPLHAPPGDLDLPLHLHPTMELGPQRPQVEPIPTQADTVPKVSAIRREVRKVFQEEEDEAWAARVCGYTMHGNLFALLQAENEKHHMEVVHVGPSSWCLEICCEQQHRHVAHLH
jgi:hypothetical protein